jgi:hydroxymethylpyrimidine kinase/phosphomethylpyrimidine kinase
MRTALTIAGSDSGGGAGIQADLKTFAAFGVFGTSAITALTAQNTVAVTGVHLAPPEFVVAQINAVVTDLGCDAVKTGMLGTAAIVEAVAAAIRRQALPNVVVDPVMVAKSGVGRCCRWPASSRRTSPRRKYWSADASSRSTTPSPPPTPSAGWARRRWW